MNEVKSTLQQGKLFVTFIVLGLYDGYYCTMATLLIIVAIERTQACVVYDIYE